MLTTVSYVALLHGGDMYFRRFEYEAADNSTKEGITRTTLKNRYLP